MRMRRAPQPSSVQPKRHPPAVPRAPNSLPDRRLSSSETVRHKLIARAPKKPDFLPRNFSYIYRREKIASESPFVSR
jgi:hypothetical protein